MKFAIAILVLVLIGCGTEPKPTPTAVPTFTPVPTATHLPTPTPVANDLPRAIQILSVEYQDAYRLLSDGEYAQMWYARTFGDFSQERFDQASTDTPTNTEIPIDPFDAGQEYNLKRALAYKQTDSKEWIEAKVKELIPDYLDKFSEAEDAEGRLAVLNEAVMAGDIRNEVLDAEIFLRWQSRLAGMTQEQTDVDIVRVLQWHEQMLMWHTMSERDIIIRNHELRVCQLVMQYVAGIYHTVDVVSNNECDIQRVVELANEAIRSGRDQYTEDDYREWLKEDV